jgi:hypothetical protein
MSLGGAQIAHVRAVPSRLSQAAQFQSSDTSSAFTIEGPIGCVVDVEVTFRGNAYGVAVNAQNALVGATAGATYYRGLDGEALASTLFIPAIYGSATN